MRHERKVGLSPWLAFSEVHVQERSSLSLWCVAFVLVQLLIPV